MGGGDLHGETEMEKTGGAVGQGRKWGTGGEMGEGKRRMGDETEKWLKRERGVKRGRERGLTE